jgi:hypothetical protein
MVWRQREAKMFFTAEDAEEGTSKAVRQAKTAAKFFGRFLSSPTFDFLSCFSSASSAV